jgi:membrane protein DedA with SNARE-associated domain
MNLAHFLLYTTLGAGAWAIILTYFGYFVGDNQELFATYKHIAIVIGAILLALAIWIKILIAKKF